MYVRSSLISSTRLSRSGEFFILNDTGAGKISAIVLNKAGTGKISAIVLFNLTSIK